MRPAFPLALLLLEVSATLAAKVVPISFTKEHVSRTDSSLRRRASYIPVTLGNAQILYYANVTVGTPGKDLQLQVDTGSSDVWMTDSTAEYCSEAQDNCQGGTFDPRTSSTYKPVSGTIFNITYVDGSGSTGNYFTDDFSIGGATITGLQMGLATDTTIGTGIIGVCFEADESVCNSYSVCQVYPSIMSQMVSQGLINSQAYSLYLDDLNSYTGTILFGGVDTTKYTGSLTTIPIQKSIYSGTYTSFSVAFTGLTITSSSGTSDLTGSGYAEAAILDSGTTLTLLPDDLFKDVASNYNLEYLREAGLYIAPCSDSSSSTIFNFQFGGSDGPVIKVVSTEFFQPLQGYTTSNGAQACEFGILPAGNDPILFGDTFLRSAYVVYDLDNKEISLAQSNFDATSSNILEIQAGIDGVPNVSNTASGVSVSQTATGVNSYPVESTGSITGTGAAVTGSSTGAATALKLPSTDITGVVMLGLGSMLALLGSCFIFL